MKMAVTLPILKIVQDGKLDKMAIGEVMKTKQGTYTLTRIGSPELHDGNEAGITLKWTRFTNALGT